MFLVFSFSRLELGWRLNLMCYRGVLLSPLADQTLLKLTAFLFICCFLAGTEGQVNGSHCLLCRSQGIQPDPGRIQWRILKMMQIRKNGNAMYFLSVAVCFSSLQLLQTLWNTCFLCGEASMPSGESLTRYDTYIPRLHSHKHSPTHTETHKIELCN